MPFACIAAPWQRRDRSVAVASAAFDDESASGERPGADRGSLRTSDRTCEIGHIIRESEQRGQCPRYRQRELSAGSESGVGRQRAVNSQTRSTVRCAVVIQKLSRELSRPFAIFACYGQPIGRSC